MQCQTPWCATSCGVILRGVHHTAKTHSAESNSAMWWTLHCLSQVIKSSQKTIRCASKQGVKFRGVHLNTDSNSVVCIFLQSQAKQCAMCIPPPSKAPQCASLCRVKLRSVHPSAESTASVCILLQSLPSRCDAHCGFNNLPGVCIWNRSFTNAIPLWCLKILIWK